MARDAGLRKIGDVTRWLTAGVIALSGALALLAASAFHGHSTTSTSNVSSQVAQSPANASNGLQSPQQAPQQIQQQPVVVSGGS